ncbi:hypothetical protein CEXT_733411 [Caerostris extrusa]|uniref:Uncharacterized protein n=1 Tax=Caerostris extrusa TaxID=172846 RepID=A0AAV4QY55_CAEEX|nr:hypothetical protein CEXT_733411 [Caerostris extrusa]
MAYEFYCYNRPSKFQSSPNMTPDTNETFLAGHCRVYGRASLIIAAVKLKIHFRLYRLSTPALRIPHTKKSKPEKYQVRLGAR